jgi:hypothetical protein
LSDFQDRRDVRFDRLGICAVAGAAEVGNGRGLHGHIVALVFMLVPDLAFSLGPRIDAGFFGVLGLGPLVSGIYITLTQRNAKRDQTRSYQFINDPRGKKS